MYRIPEIFQFIFKSFRLSGLNKISAGFYVEYLSRVFLLVTNSNKNNIYFSI